MLIDYYPRVVKQIREMQEICTAEQPEFDYISQEIEKILNNMFVITSDVCGIVRFEKELGIKPRPGQSLEERRVAVLVRMVKKPLSLRDIIKIIRNYCEEIDLVPDYNKDELNVKVGDNVEYLRTIYDTLDNLLALNIFIYITYEVIAFLKIAMGCIIEFEVAMHCSGNTDDDFLCNMEFNVIANTSEIFEASIVKSRDAWYLDGSVKLDGSRKLNSTEIKEEI